MSVRNMAILFAAIAVLWSCQVYESTAGIVGGGYQGGSSAEISISGFKFLPSPVAFPGAAGVTVTWTNNDGVTHTVTWDSPTPPVSNSGNIGPGGGSFAALFPNTAGTYTYHCSIHPTMTGSIVVN